MSDTNPTIIGKECKFVIHIPTKGNGVPDVHLVKEQIHYSDHTTKPNIKFIKDFKRTFYVTKPNKRNHKEKKEYEIIDNLLCKETTQSDLRNNVAKLLDKQWSNDYMKKLSQSPYLYGSDISSTSIIKKMYQDKFPECVSEYSIATYDIETDTINGTDEPIMATVVFKNKSFTAVLKSFVQGIAFVENKFLNSSMRYIGPYLDKHGITPELYVAEDIVDLLTAVFKKLHEWKPDFLAIWNMDFDIPKTINVLEKYGADPKVILCDPAVPYDFRICKYKQGPKKKVTASGKVIPINPAAQWHTLELTASFYVIDAMCSYKHIRLSKQEQQSYRLDFILNAELGIRKLSFKEADGYSGLKWHQFMQTNYKLEYMVYNIFDCLSMLELDDKTKDLAYTLASFSVTSDFSSFKSQPKRIADALHWRFLESGLIVGSTGSVEDVEDGDDDDILSLKNWIITLSSHMQVLGMCCIEEDPSIKTNLRGFVYDSDATAAYPTDTSVANVSKGTTKKEIISINGIEEDLFRLQNINIMVGNVNALEYSCNMFNLPASDKLLEGFLNSL